MAATRIKLGLVNVSIGAIANDGGMGTSLAPVGDTVIDSFVMNQADNTVSTFKRQEGGVTVASITSEYGDITLEWSSYNLSVDNLVKLFGGTKVPAVSGGSPSPEMWQAPDTLTDQFVSLKAEWEQGGYVQAPKVQLSPKLTLGFKRSAPSTIDIKATVLQPDKVGEPRLTLAANL